MLNKRFITDLNVDNKVVFLRLDLNVPVDGNTITSYKRINESLKTIEYLSEQGAKIVILSHFGRVKNLDNKAKLSLEIVANELAKKLPNKKVSFINSSKGEEFENKIKSLNNGEILVAENTRFNDIDENGNWIGLESENNDELAKYWASLCDVFVNDAFGAIHRKHASTYGIGKYQPNNAIGFLIKKEIENLDKALHGGAHPMTIIFGGAKISDKLKGVKAVIDIADYVIISGGMAYTFVKAQGFDVGTSMVEDSMIETVKQLMIDYPNKLIISSDFMCSPEFKDLKPEYRTKEEGLSPLMGLDIGPKSIKDFTDIINKSKTIVWNGPMGVTEFSNYSTGTNEICNAIAKKTSEGAITVIGGGDSAAAAEKLGKESSFSFISTGGGASLTFMEGSILIGIDSIGDK